MAPRPTLLQLDPRQVETLDLIAAEQSCSRSHLVREAIADLIKKHQDRTIAQQYRDAYTKFPQEDDDPWTDEMNEAAWKDLPW